MGSIINSHIYDSLLNGQENQHTLIFNGFESMTNIPLTNMKEGLNIGSGAHSDPEHGLVKKY